MKASTLQRYFKLGQISLFAVIFLTSCLGSKFLIKEEHILAKQTINGLSGNLKENAEALYENNNNTRLPLNFPMTHLAHLHKLGENGISFGPRIERKEMRLNDLREIYNHKINHAESEEKKLALKEERERIIARKAAKIAKKKDVKRVVLVPGYKKDKAIFKKKKIERKYDRKIEKATKEKRKQKLRARKVKKLDKKDRKIKQGNQFMRWGEPLAIYEHNESRVTAENIRQYLIANGYFDATVTVDTSTYDSLNSIGKFGRKLRNNFSRIAGAKHRYINVAYDVDKKQHYFIDSIQYVIEDPVLKDLIMEHVKDAPLKKGFYNQSKISEERDFIYNLAVNNGYYEFSKQNILFKIDTTAIGQDTVLIQEVIRNPPGKNQHKIFYLDSIIFVSDASVRETYNRTIEKQRDVTFSFGKNRYSKKVLEWRIPLEQDDRYSRDLTIETQRQLSFLDNFKFININYDTLDNHFIATIFTSPFDKYQTSSEFGLSSNTQGIPGPFFNVNLKNRNTFRGLEVINFDLNAKLQDLSKIREDEDSDFTGTYTSRQFGGEISVTFPQFLFPLGSSFKRTIGPYNPQTKLSIGSTFEDRVEDYTQLRYQGSVAYSWQVKDKVKYTLTPIQLTVNNTNTTASFDTYLDNLAREGNTYVNAFQSAVVSSMSFQRDQNFGNYGLGDDGAFLRLYFESGGNISNVFGDQLFSENLERYKFIKANVDLRKIERLRRKLNLAMRLNIGYALPYGENQALPYDRYFFVGGSSSIRGWRPRRLGPGGFANYEEEADGTPTSVVNYDFEQPGEILLESSVELRQDLVGFLEGAFFIDAGNIWLIRNTTDNPERDRGVFEFDTFASQIAVAAGVGVRFDLQFLIFRLDLGVKMFDPAQPKGERFVGDQIFSNFGPNKEFNIGIGYPF